MYQNSYQKLLKRSRKLYLIVIGLLFILILMAVGKQHYVDVMNNPIKLSDIQLDIPRGMGNYENIIKNKETLAKNLAYSIQSSVESIFEASAFLFLLLAMLAIFTGFEIIKREKYRDKIAAIIAIFIVGMLFFSFVPSDNILRNNDNQEAKVTEYAGIFKMVGYYTDQNKSKEDINYLSNQLYALVAPEYITPNDIGRPIEKLPNRIGYLFEQAMKQDGVKWGFDADDSVIIANKARKYEKEYKDIAEYNAIVLWYLQWIMIVILSIATIIAAKMTTTRFNVKKKIKLIQLKSFS